MNTITHRNNTPEQMVEAIFALDLDPIKLKLMDKEEGQGWSRAQADHYELEYKRFLALLARFPDEVIAPSSNVDKVWHAHILDTMKYAEDCQNIFGYFLHHFPYFGMRGEEDAANLRRAADNMKQLYEQEFGAAAQSGGAAYCGAAKDVSASAYCGAAKPGTAAYCGAAKPAETAAYCGAAKPVEASAYCGAAKSDTTAYCGAAKPVEATAYCGAAKSETAAYCGATAASAYCGAAQPAATTAYCGAAKEAQSAYCGAAKGADRTAYCGVVAGLGRPKLEPAEALA
jgi:hypothetical protein